ncbi:hypothetical protein [Treponema phagedenis]|uniref:hypothetical protein n=1 Tax=Treponema phagedenis TaxID=162 RepID=UPI001251A545|nr:hypothetical protein [Treponema phagedenis]TYT78441.1 hypothetical protein FS559_04560 [Treponema phagedenis]
MFKSINTNISIRTATDGGGSKQERCFKTGYLQSFKTRRLSFAMDGKIRTGTDARGSTQTGLVLTWTSKLRTATDGGGSTQKRCFKAK